MWIVKVALRRPLSVAVMALLMARVRNRKDLSAGDQIALNVGEGVKKAIQYGR